MAEAVAVDETADTADALAHVNHVGEFLLFGQALQAPVDETDGGDGLDDLLIFQYQVQVDGFRQNRMLRPEGDDRLLSHYLTSPAFAGFVITAWAAAVASALVSLKGVFLASW